MLLGGDGKSNPEKSILVITVPGKYFVHFEQSLQDACPVKPHTFLAAGTSHPTQRRAA